MRHEDVPKPLEVHLDELRSRLIRSVLYVLAATMLAFGFHNELFKFVLAPATDLLKSAQGQIITTRPSEAFFAHMNLALIAGVILASPGLVAELLGFLWPALPGKVRKFVFLIIPSAVGLFCAGVAFSYFIVVPIILRFFIHFATVSQMQSLYTIGEYVSFLTRMCLLTGASFEVPVVVVLLGLAGLVSGSTLAAGRPYVIVIILVVAAVVTPTGDPVTMSLVSAPVYILFEGSLFLVWLIERARRKAGHNNLPANVPEDEG